MCLMEKILKYENNVSYLYVDGKYKKLLEISKEDILKSLESDIQNNKLNSGGFDYIQRLVEFLRLYPVDLMVGIMKDIKNNYGELYKIASENEEFIDLYFQSYSLIRG